MSTSEDKLLNAQIRERLSIRVGFPRLLLVILPSAIFATGQTLYLVKSMFELQFSDYWLMFAICGLLNILSMLFLGVQIMNAKGEELYEVRQSEFVGLYTESKKKEVSQEEQSKLSENAQKRQAIMDQINHEATVYGVWLANLCYLISFVFMSFVVFRFWSTSWNYYASTLGAMVLTQYLPFYFVREPSYNFE